MINEPYIAAFIIGAAFIFGTCIGSFLNVVIWRLPREESLGGRSHCPKCSHKLMWHNLIPVLSFVMAGGKCAYCRKSVSPRYPIIELTTGVLFALAAYYYIPLDVPTLITLIKLMLIIALGIVVFVVDLEHYLILDKVILPSAVLILLITITQALIAHSFSPFYIALLSSFFAAVPFWLIWKVSKGEWMGYGDVKFIALMGWALGWPGIGIALFMAIMLGAIVGILLIASGRKHLSSKLPFGTFLSVAMVLAALFGSSLWAFYWRLFAI
jgi:prepilin signal peptidase PulO-like enzyme (type II secretory pathway)